MYGVVRRYRAKSGEHEDIIEKAERHYVEIVSNSPGFIAFYVVHEGDTAMTISIFHSEEETRASDDKAASFVREHLAEHVEGPLEVVRGSVVVSKVAHDK